MASRPPSNVYRGIPEPHVELPPPEIPKSRMPWFIVLLALFAIATVVGMLIGFWRAASPAPETPGLEQGDSPARPGAPAP